MLLLRFGGRRGVSGVVGDQQRAALFFLSERGLRGGRNNKPPSLTTTITNHHPTALHSPSLSLTDDIRRRRKQSDEGAVAGQVEQAAGQHGGGDIDGGVDGKPKLGRRKRRLSCVWGEGGKESVGGGVVGASAG
jgi:hypothetical protein